MIAMRRMLMLAAPAAFAALVLGAVPATAEPRDAGARTAGNTDFSAQSRVSRARPQLRINPRYPYRRFHSFYPLPYPIEYPGPNAVRQCADRYVVEYRPSGTVIVPQMRCRWVSG